MSDEAETTEAAKAVRRSAIPKAIVIVALAFVLVFAGAVVATRFGVLLPQVRLLIEARTDGLKIGRLGQLKVEGLSGDIWRDFSIRRLTIRDEKGVWLQAENVHLTWRYAELLRRRFDADLIEAQAVRVLRRPTLGPKGKDSGLPVSFHIEQARTRLFLEPAFSQRRGVYDLALRLDVARRGGQSGVLGVKSLLHPGDHLDVDFRFGGKGPLRLVANAEEARGGALAGALGLPADRPFKLDVRAAGAMAEGRVTATAVTGNQTPLIVRGAWTPSGGQAGGRLLLATSSLTAPYAARLGPEVRIGVAGRKAADGLYALELRVLADAVTVRASGAGDVGRRTLAPAGMKMDARAPSLGRIVGGADLGPARVTGVLKGVASDWRFTGAGDLRGVGLGPYRLGRIGGPIEFGRAKGVMTLRAKLAGADGAGQGLAAALLGARPTASLDGQRLANGQWLLRRVDIVGAGLKVEASGGRSLLGAVNVKGKAAIANLAAARLGAGGAAELSWQASQARAAAPWTISAEARGRGFAVGMAELDRLLGPEPRARLQANWQDGRLAVAKAEVVGAALRANGAGVMQPDGALAFKTDWNASGPFHAGPVEITGRARGDGAVSGTLRAPRLDLTANLDAVDIPRLPLRDARLTLTFQQQADGSSGAVAMTATSQHGPATARSAFRFPRGGVDLTDLAIDAGGVKAQGALSLRRNSPSAADLTLDVGRGALLDAGRVTGTLRIVDGAGGPRAALKLHADRVRPTGAAFQVRAADIAADGPLARLPYVASAEGASQRGAWRIGGRGVLADLAPGYALSFDGAGKLGARELRTTEAAMFRFAGDDRSARLRLAASDGGRIDLDGSLRGQAVDIKARAAGLGLTLFDPDLAGRVDADLVVQGQGHRLTGNLDARLNDARDRAAPAVQGMDGSLRARLTGDTVTLDLDASNEQGLRANANLVLPAESSAAPFRIAIARQRPMRGRFFAEGEVRPLWALAIGGERALSGVVRTEGTIGGTLADPRASGQLTMERGRFDDGSTGLSLRDVAIKAAFTEDEVNVLEARGVDGRGGQASGQGRISLARDGVSSFRLDLRGFRLIDNEMATASASGQASINRGADGKVKLTGDLTIDRADVAADPPTPSGVIAMDVREVNRPDDLPSALPATQKRGNGWDLDIRLNAPRRVFLRGRGLDLELSLAARVTGTTTRPDLGGTARVVRGDYDFAGKRFEFDDRGVVYLSTRPEQIRLRLDATREDPTLSVTVQIRGTAARPEVALSSSPSLPNDEILAKVLFERSASQLSPVEAAQLASALSSLTGGGGLDVIGNLRSFARLDRLAFGGDQQSGVTVSGGKYLTDDVYLEVTGGGREGPSAQVEWRIRKSLSILSRFAGQSGNRLAVRWRKDY